MNMFHDREEGVMQRRTKELIVCAVVLLSEDVKFPSIGCRVIARTVSIEKDKMPIKGV